VIGRFLLGSHDATGLQFVNVPEPEQNILTSGIVWIETWGFYRADKVISDRRNQTAVPGFN